MNWKFSKFQRLMHCRVAILWVYEFSNLILANFCVCVCVSERDTTLQCIRHSCVTLYTATTQDDTIKSNAGLSTKTSALFIKWSLLCQENYTGYCCFKSGQNSTISFFALQINPSSGKSSVILFPSLWDEEKSKKTKANNLQRLSSLMTSSHSLGDFR